jgi:hypothetical protein
VRKFVRGVWPRKTFDRIVELAYTATVEPSAWTDALQLIGEGIDGAPTAIHVHSELTKATTLGVWGMPTSVTLKHYEEYYAARNIWLLRGERLMKPGAILTARTCVRTRSCSGPSTTTTFSARSACATRSARF